VAVGAALCKALEATRSSPSSIKNRRVRILTIVGVDIIVQSGLFARKIFEKEGLFRPGEGRRPFLKSKKTTRNTKIKEIPRGR